MKTATLRPASAPRAMGLRGRTYCVWSSIDSMSELGQRPHSVRSETNTPRTPGREEGL